MHANLGVDKGMAAGGKPVEIMGMMLGRPDTETPNTLIVTDVSEKVLSRKYSRNLPHRPLLLASVKIPLHLQELEARVHFEVIEH